jgi:FixJ family two-component response regulator
LAPTVFVVCADPVRTARLHAWLRAAGHAVELFDSVASFVRGDRGTRPGCVIVDLALADQSTLAEEAPTLPRIGIASADVRAAIAAMKAGAVDVLDEQLERPELLAAVEAALARDVALRRGDAARMQRAARLAALTAREREVLEGVAHGLLNKQIAAELNISEATVRFHRANGTAKLGVDSVAELVRLLTGE